MAPEFLIRASLSHNKHHYKSGIQNVKISKSFSRIISLRIDVFDCHNQSQQVGETAVVKNINAQSNQSDRAASINEGRRRKIGDIQTPEQPPICDEKIFRRKVKNPESRKSSFLHLSGEQNCLFRGNVQESSDTTQLEQNKVNDKQQIFRKRGLSQVLQIVQDQRKLKDITEKQQQQQQPSVSESTCLKTEKKKSIADTIRDNNTVVKQKQIVINRRQNVLGLHDKDKLKKESNQGINNLLSQYHLSNKENEFNQIDDLKQDNTQNMGYFQAPQPQNNQQNLIIQKNKDQQIKKLTLLEDIQFNQFTSPSTPTSTMSRRPSRIDSSLLREQRLSVLQDFKKSDFHCINLTTRSVSSTPSSRLFKRQYSNSHSTNTSQVNQQPSDNLYNVSPPNIIGWNPGITEQQQNHLQLSENSYNHPNQQILTTNPSSSIIVGNVGSSKLTPRNDHKLHLFISSQKKLLTNVNTNKSIGQLSCKASKQTVTDFSNHQQHQQKQLLFLDS